MESSRPTSTPLHVVWIQPGRLEAMLAAATHLDTTQELRALGAKVTLFAHGEEGLSEIRGVEVHHLPREDIYLLGQLMFHRRALSAIRRMEPPPDVVLFHQASAFWLFPSMLWRRVRGRSKPLAVMDTRSVHMPPAEGESLRGRFRRYYLDTMSGLANRWCDGQTAITERMAENVGIPAGRLWGVWPSGVNPRPFRLPRRWPSPGEPVRVIYIGSLNKERNLPALVRAVLRARQAGANLQLSLVGDGDAWAELETLTRDTGEAVTLSPPVPYEEVPALLAAHHVGALPFPDEEKFRVSSPIKLFEYMASGMPILATRIVCHTDVLAGRDCVFWSETGRVADLEETLLEVHRARENLPEMGEVSALESENWTWNAAATKLLRALQGGLERADRK